MRTPIFILEKFAKGREKEVAHCPMTEETAFMRVNGKMARETEKDIKSPKMENIPDNS